MFHYACIFGDRPGNVKLPDFWMETDDPPIKENNTTVTCWSQTPLVVLIWKVGMTRDNYHNTQGNEGLDKVVQIYNIKTYSNLDSHKFQRLESKLLLVQPPSGKLCDIWAAILQKSLTPCSPCSPEWMWFWNISVVGETFYEKSALSRLKLTIILDLHSVVPWQAVWDRLYSPRLFSAGIRG